MTKFTTHRKNEKKRLHKKTKFNKRISTSGEPGDCQFQPEDFDNVELITDLNVTDSVFLAWDNDNPNGIIYIGVKGDEFN